MNPIDNVLNLLQGVKERGDYFTASCPAHDDNEPSLSIRIGDDGRVLLKCFTGCAVEDIVAAIDLEMKDLFEEGGEGVLSPPATLHHCITPPETCMTKPKKVMQWVMHHLMYHCTTWMPPRR
jgi:hypothetical protein